VAQQRGLPGAGVADEGEEPLPPLDAVGQRGGRLLDARVAVEEAGIGRDPEGRLPEPEVLLVPRRRV